MRTVRALLVASLLIVLVSSGLFAQSKSYIPVVEWTGTQFRALNATGSYEWQLVNDPVVDVDFSSLGGLVVWNDGTHTLSYVVDSANERVQFFETDIRRASEQTADFSFSETPSGGQFSRNSLLFHNGGVVGGTELVMINGEVFSRVNDLGGYTTGDLVYTIVYDGDAGTGGVLTFPDNTLANGDEIDIEYCYSSDPVQDLSGDIDYSRASTDNNGASNGSPFGISEYIPDNPGHPASFDSLAAIAFNENTVGTATADLYLLDGAEVSPALHAFKVQDDATVFEWVSTYDGPLSSPSDVAVAQSELTNTLAIGNPVAADEWTFVAGSRGPALSQTVLNNALITNHDYRITCVVAPLADGADLEGARFRFFDVSTGDTIGFYEIAAGGGPGYDLDGIVPGMRITLEAEDGATPTTIGAGDYAELTLATEAVINEYLFITDTGNDRIKVLKGGDNGEQTTNGLESDFFGDDVYRRDDFGLAPYGNPPNQTYITASQAMEGTLEVFTFDGLDRIRWDLVEDLGTSTALDSDFTYDYATGVIHFGDGNHGAAPQAGDSLYATYRPVLDVLNYTGADSTDSLAAPSGITARWNNTQGWYDVYVADRGNNRIVKLKLIPSIGGQSASMHFVTALDSAFAGMPFLSLTRLTVAEDPVTGQVCLFACDSTRILQYRDRSAEANGDGGSDPPELFATINSRDTGLGEFSNPSGISVHHNGTGFDIFVTDADRDVVIKFEEYDLPTVDADYSELVAGYPYPPTGSFTFRKNPGWTGFAKDYPDSAYISFFYSDTTSVGRENPLLCSEVHLQPVDVEYEWIFQDTPDGPPQDGYYNLYTRLYDKNGILLAQVASDPASPLIISSSLAQGIGAFDSRDIDMYLTLQNSTAAIIDLNVVYPDSIAAVSFLGSYPSSRIRILAIEEGPGWNTISNMGTIFTTQWDSAGGDFQVSTAVLGSNTGLVSGPAVFTVARITVQALDSVITPDTRYLNTTLNLTGGTWSDYHGTEVTLPYIGDLALRFGYLGDIASPTGNRGTIPHFVPNPDGEIGIDDIIVFTLAWNGLGGVQDPIADLAPFAGSPPNLAANPDGGIDILDLFAFTTMINWFEAQNFGTLAAAPVVQPNPKERIRQDYASSNNSEAASHLSVRLEQDDNGTWVLKLDAIEVTELAVAELKLRYNPERSPLLTCDDGGFLTDGQGLFTEHERTDGLKLYLSRLNRRSPGVSGSGPLAELRFAAEGKPQDVEITYDLRNKQGAVIESGTIRAGKQPSRYTASAETVPGSYMLEQNYPNPFNPATTIRFGLPEAGKVSVEIYNTLGRLVAVPVNGRFSAGYHTLTWNADQSGQPLASGLYFCVFRAGSFHTVRKMLLIR